ncbi:fumarylacetoacetate hydrolase family protein [Pseudemcibacter aquimaris]|uniref:fumarylacetoacetate hydrolase family protein n=1 Tax=Pseudemcibacter aquimaris TaxID=2857064 RepID=UPI002012E228|nr:fumarylacetoacetate hydrolase family protein [Pseudemcibacter aquimaris]MCC3861602.1 fumarylacetoacetate hydrolase family protein [Pseudemcibacter aquimaris]WDU58371.1 fumarylacetoacetate hydrolase family protein [Pseudemcibacter aquimaris]
MKFNFKRVSLSLVTTLIIASNSFAESYVRYEKDGMAFWGELKGNIIHQLSNAPYLDGALTGETVDKSGVKMLAPVDPKDVYMTGFNYEDHIPEGQKTTPYPGLFMVPAGTIIGPEDDIIHPADSNFIGYEAETVIVIGKRADNVSVEDAADYIFGVTAGNDVSARDWIPADIQWFRGKGAKGFNSVGPVLQTGLDYKNLNLTARLNGEVRQQGNTSKMIHNFEKMVSYISKYFVLNPGDLIWSGTIGTSEQLKVGDEYEIEIEGVGILKNNIVQGK